MGRNPLRAIALVAVAALAGCTSPVAPEQDSLLLEPAFSSVYEACWGQATKVFAQLGEMGEHASQQSNPRVGLANLAKALYDAGVLDAPTIQALGAWVAAEYGLSIDACMG